MASKKDLRRPDLGTLAPDAHGHLIPSNDASYGLPLLTPINPQSSPTRSPWPRAKAPTWPRPCRKPSLWPPSLRATDTLDGTSCPPPTKREKTYGTPVKLTTCPDRTAVVVAVQNWLGESEENQKNSSTPGYFSVGMSLMSLAVTYLPMFLPPPPGGAQKTPTGTEAAPPMPPA